MITVFFKTFVINYKRLFKRLFRFQLSMLHSPCMPVGKLPVTKIFICNRILIDSPQIRN